jgi:hypothetical protein
MNRKGFAFALAAGFLWAGSAPAAISPGDGQAGNPPGEIFVTVWDADGQISYTRDLGISVVDFINNPSQSFTFSPDTLYTDTFNGVDPATLVYTVGGFNARFNDFPCCYGMAISSNNTPPQVFIPDVTALATALATGGFYAAGVNSDAGDLTNFAVNLSAVSLPGSPGYYDGEYWGGNIGLTVPFQTGATVGAPVSFYLLVLDEDGVTVNRTLVSKSWILRADGTLTNVFPVISPSPAAIDLGNVRQAQVEQQTLTVRNTGSANLMTGQVGSNDPIAPPFSITNNTCNNRNLAPNATCTLNVRLTGNTLGAKSDSFNIPSNDPVTPNLIVNVTGTVVQKVGVASIAGIATTTAKCTNQNTGQSVNITLSGATSLNCETAGLTPVAPGHTVIIQINGTRVSGSVVGGTLRSEGLTLVQCQNLTTGQNRNFDPAPPGPNPRNWNCLGGGWTAATGNSVRMTVRGPAD